MAQLIASPLRSGVVMGPDAFAPRTSLKILAEPTGSIAVFSWPETEIAPAQSVSIIEIGYSTLPRMIFSGRRKNAVIFHVFRHIGYA